jgi:putative ABC transport system permease protein
VTTFLNDLRLAVRSTLKARGFAAATILTLALGITLCLVSVIVTRAYLLRDLPYPAADRLYSVQYGAPGQMPPRDMEQLDWGALDGAIEHAVAWDLDVFYLLGGEHAETVPGAWITPGFAEALGIRPAFGPGLGPGAFTEGSANEVLISHRLWNERFGGDPGIVGRTFPAYVSDRPQEAETFTIAGVLPSSFWHVNPYTDILAPLRTRTYPYMVRLRPGVPAHQAETRIAALVRAGTRDLPPEWSVTLTPSHDGYVRTVRPMLRAVTAASVLVLVVACANAAGLLLIRATRRQKDVAVRAALGATPSAIARMLFAEGLVVGGTATALALTAAGAVLRSLGPLVQQQLGRPAPGGAAAFALDWQTAVFSVAMGAGTALVCSAAPFIASVRSLKHALQGTGRTATEGRRSQRLRLALIGLEIAASLALVAGATLMLRSAAGMMRTDLGFEAERVITASVTLRQTRYPDAASRGAIFERMLARLSQEPGAESVAMTTWWPVQQPRSESIGSEATGGSVRAALHRVSGRYFSTLGIPLLAGRGFADADADLASVVVVSETLAARLSPDGNVVGRRVVIPEPRDGRDAVPVTRTVTGIVGDVRQGPADQDLTDVYLPFHQNPGRFGFVLMRSRQPGAGSITGLRSAFRDIDPEIAVHRPGLMQARVDELTAGSRFMASLLSGFASIAALLALVGVYGVIAYAVRQREREIALRIALGASPIRLMWLFVRQGGAVLLAGVGLGVVLALAGGRLIESQLFGVTARDPQTLAIAAAGFAAAGLFAIWWPSRRAAGTDPAVALRNE